MPLRVLFAAAVAACLALPAPHRADDDCHDCRDEHGHRHSGECLRLEFAAPPDAIHVNGAVDLQVRATGQQPPFVELLRDGLRLATVRPPYAFRWDTATETEGTHQLTARVANGRCQVVSSPRMVVVDRTPPQVVALVPSPGQEGVPAGDPLVATFDEPLLATSVSDLSVVVSGPDGAVLAKALALSADGKTLTVALSAPPPAHLTVTLTSALTDLAGNPLASPTVPWTVGFATTRWVALGGGPLRTPGWASSMAPRVAVSSDGTVLVARIRNAISPLTEMGQLAVASWDGASWSDLGGRLDDATSGLGWASLELDEAGRPVVLWSEIGAAGWALRSTRWDGTSWTPLGVPLNLDPGCDVSSSLASGPSALVAAWQEYCYLQPETNHVALWDGAAWVALGTPPPLTSPRVAVDGAGQIWLSAFGVGAWRWDGAAWTQVGDFPMANGLDLTARGADVAVAYVFPGGEVRVERWTGAGWTQLGDATGGMQLPAVADVSVRLDPGGNPVVAWRSDTAIFVSRWDGAAWVQLGEALTGPLVSWASLALDPAGDPVVAGDVLNTEAGTLESWVTRLAR
jgi:hypothetical protein